MDRLGRVHSAVTPRVNSIGSTNSHRKPMLWRPYRVSISRKTSAQITRRWISHELPKARLGAVQRFARHQS